MDVRLPIKTALICLAVLLCGCSPGDEKHVASLEEKTAKFEQALDAITDSKLKDAITELGGSLLLLERAQLKLADNPPRTEYGEDALVKLDGSRSVAAAIRYLYPGKKPSRLPADVMHQGEFFVEGIRRKEARSRNNEGAPVLA